jgi:hypothetical protein
MTIWTNEWNEKGQLPSTGEPKPRALEEQYDEHNAITGRPETRMPMRMSSVRFFRLGFIGCIPG